MIHRNRETMRDIHFRTEGQKDRERHRDRETKTSKRVIFWSKVANFVNNL